MELVKKRIHMNKCDCKKSKQLTLDNDFNVPDAKADALAIIKEQGKANVEEVRYNGGKGVVKGTLEFSILYVGDESGRPVVDFAGSIPFEETVTMDDNCREDEISVRVRIDDLHSELINSRKLGIKAILNMEFVAESIFDGESATDIEDGADVLTREKSIPITQLVLCKKDTFRFRDEWNLPGTKESIEKILYQNVQICETDTRLMDGKISITGQVKCFLIYMTAEEPSQLEYYENLIPMSGTIECNGCNEGMIPHIEVGLHGSDIAIKEDSDGERRVMDLELVLDLFIKAYEEEELTFMTDFYSTSCELRPVFVDSYFENLLMKNNSKMRVVGKIKLPEAIHPLQIWNVDGALRVDSQKIVDNGLLVQGIIDVSAMYVLGDDSMPLGASKGIIPFEHLVEIDGVTPESKVLLGESLDQISGVMLGENEIEIKATLSFDVIAFEPITTPMIADYTKEELDMEKFSERPGLVGYMVKESECLWDIAKEFYTTCASIMELNEKESEELQPGEVLLLMNEMVPSAR